MDLAGAMLAQGRHVHRGAITHVPLEAVGGKLLGVLQHQVVTDGLGQNGGRSNGRVLVITANDGLDTQTFQPGSAVAVDADMTGLGLQPLDGAGHGQQGGMQDVEAVDLFDAGTGHRERQGLLPDLVGQGFPAAGAEFLRVPQALDGGDRARGPRPPPRFGRVYGYCVASIFLFHLFINVGMVLGLVPVIGIPLPFFSYGGSSLWGFTFLLFIFLGIDSRRKQHTAR